MIFNKQHIEISKFESDLDSYIYLSIKKHDAIRKRENYFTISNLELSAKKGKIQLKRTIDVYCQNYNPKLLMEILKTRADNCEKRIEKLRKKEKSTIKETVEAQVLRETKLVVAKKTLERIF